MKGSGKALAFVRVHVHVHVHGFLPVLRGSARFRLPPPPPALLLSPFRCTVRQQLGAHGPDDLLHLVVETKGYRREDAKEKKSTMDTYWVPGVNHLGNHGRWAFAEFTEVWQMQADFAKKVEAEFNKMMDEAAPANNAAALSN